MPWGDSFHELEVEAESEPQEKPHTLLAFSPLVNGFQFLSIRIWSSLAVTRPSLWCGRVKKITPEILHAFRPRLLFSKLNLAVLMFLSSLSSVCSLSHPVR